MHDESKEEFYIIKSWTHWGMRDKRLLVTTTESVFDEKYRFQIETK